MKIVFDIIAEKSGANVWTDRLCTALNQTGISSSIRSHSFFSIFSPLQQFGGALEPGVIQHANSWNGWAFKTTNPLIITEHTAIHEPYLSRYKTIPQRLYHRQVKTFESRSLEAADCVTCVSRYTRDFLERTFGYSGARVIPNGVDTELFRPSEGIGMPPDTYRDKTVILFVGNYTRLKGADLLPAIMDQLDDRFVLLVTAGFRRNVNPPGKTIINIGTLDQNGLVNAHRSCDIFLFPSRLEGFGLSVAEAMACGKPVVTTNCSALPELVVDGKGGFLCRMDDAKDFAGKIRYLAEDENLRRRMGIFNRQRVEEEFLQSRMVREYIDVYRSL